MASRRMLKVAEAIREVVSMAILTELKDPRIGMVTVTSVEVTPDLRQAKINVSIMGNETQQQTSLRGLENATGFLQSKVASRIDTRYTPRLQFSLDQGVKRSIELAEILARVLPPEKRVPPGEQPPDPDGALASAGEAGASDEPEEGPEDEFDETDSDD